MQWSGIQAGPLVPLEGVLKSWVDINRKILKSWSPDFPWRYNERASLSILAGAIWKKGGFALEEFTTEKYKVVSRSSKIPATAGGYKWGGRGDLYFELGGLEYEVEAKLWRTPINKAADPQNGLIKKLEDAVLDASRNRVYDNRLHIGILFITPFISYRALGKKNNILLKWRTYLNQWIDAAGKVPNAAAAWFFPKNLKFARFINSPKSDHFYPGVIMLLKEARSVILEEEQKMGLF